MFECDILREKEAVLSYFKIDSSDPEPEDAFREVAKEIIFAPGNSLISKIVKTNVQFELVNLSEVPETRDWHIRELENLVNDVQPASPLRPIADHMPFLKYGWSDSSRREFQKLARGTLIGLERSGTDSARGTAVEYMVSMLINNAGIEGLYALPAYARQERSTRKIDGKNYNWDITAISTGESLPVGMYPVQVKAKKRDTYTIHPDIKVVNARQLFDTSQITHTLALSLTRELDFSLIGGPQSTWLKECKKRLLTRLAIDRRYQKHY